VIEREQDHAEYRGQERGRRLGEQLAQALLDGDDLEEPVHRLRQVGVERRLEVEPRHLEAELERHPREDPLLDELDDVQLRDAKRARREGPQDHEGDQPDDGLQEEPALNQPDDRLHREGQREAQQAHQRGVEVDEAHLALLARKELEGALQRRDAGILGAGSQVAGGRDRQETAHRHAAAILHQRGDVELELLLGAVGEEACGCHASVAPAREHERGARLRCQPEHHGWERIGLHQALDVRRRDRAL
jgi:hypothetical protein